MSTFVVPLETVDRSEVSRAGAKAAALGTLLKAGFPVPPGLCVTSGAFRLALAPLGSRIDEIAGEHDLCNPDGAKAASERISALLSDLTVPSPVAEELAGPLASATAGRTPVAVRSSATSEDGVETSYAGQYTSVLGVQTERAVLDAIVTCWRSFYSANALAARATHDALGEREAMAVLIQPMVDAECAGVCFSVDPVRHRRDRILVSAAWGLGSGVVEGSVETDTVWVRRDRFVIDERHVAEQTAQIALDPGGGVRRVRVPEERRRAACLPATWARRVAQFGVAAEGLLGRPQDVEWAIAHGQVWVLQSRPITVLPPDLARPRPFPVTWTDEADRRRLWTLVEFSGREGQALLPLERDYEAVLESVREETCRFLGADRNQATRVINGRIYSTPMPLDLTDSDMRIRRAAREDLKQRLWDQGRTAWDRWGPEVVRATERLRAFDPHGADGPALAEHLSDALAVRRRHYVLHPTLWSKPQPSFITAFERVSGHTGPAAEAEAHRLIDIEETPATDLVDRLYTLACIAREAPAVAALIADPQSDALDWLAALPESAAFRAQWDELIALYGERTGRGYGFEPTIMAPTWRDQPEQVLRTVAAYLDPAVERPATMRARARQARTARVEALCAACGDREAAATFRRELAQARRWSAVLDLHNHYIDQMALGQLRHAALAAADWLVAHDVLERRDDVFWLRFEEVQSALRSRTHDTLADTVSARRAQHAEWAALEAPPILGVPGTSLPARPPLVDQAVEATPQRPGLVIGQGASSGRYRGRARVVLDSAAMPELSKGEVLVARNAAPRWTPLFPILGALVLDEGSPAQHAAATAREYGVPAVIRTHDGTRHIRNGDWVVVDGAAGTVQVKN